MTRVLIRAMTLALILLTAAVASPAGAEPGSTKAGVSAPSTPSTGEALPGILRPGDRLLFVGDEITQQMFYTRAIGAALLPLMPKADLRIYNGGYEGATAQSALLWIDDLLDLAKPTVVFVMFGLNDGKEQPPDPTILNDFRHHLAALTRRIKGREGVRCVILLGPPSVQRSISDDPEGTGYNRTLRELGKVAQSVAQEQSVAFGDLFPHTLTVNREATRLGETMCLGGRLPTEPAHVVIASVILSGIGVTGEQLNGIGWSPLMPRRMVQIRNALGLATQPASLEQSQASHQIYESLMAFDEAFFRAWRLCGPGKPPSAPDRSAVMALAEQAWGQVQSLAEPPAPATPPSEARGKAR